MLSTESSVLENLSINDSAIIYGKTPAKDYDSQCKQKKYIY